MMIDPILVIEIAISAAVMMSIATCAISLWSIDGPVLRLVALAFLGISLEILFAITASFFLNNTSIFAIVKSIGRVIEAISVLYFFVQLPRVVRAVKLAQD